MFELKGKIIFIISREEWGLMRMSKQHYAIQLSLLGNTVFFINTPDQKKRLKRGQLKVDKTEFTGLYNVLFRLYQPLFRQNSLNQLFSFLTRIMVWRLQWKVGKPDIIWHFDPSGGIPMHFFDSRALKIYMPVDGPFSIKSEMNLAETSDVILSVTERIMEHYKKVEKPKLIVDHGLPDVFINNQAFKIKNNVEKVGYSGSIVRGDLNNEFFLLLIKENPGIEFHFWGECDPKNSSMHLQQDIPDYVYSFLDEMNKLNNVVLHGAVPTGELAKGTQSVDILFIAYKIQKDQNHHKVLEYIATGTPIVSSYMSSYDNVEEGLLYMLHDGATNEELLRQFQQVVKNYDKYYTEKLYNIRLEYAKKNTYKSRIKTIENFFNEHQISNN